MRKKFECSVDAYRASYELQHLPVIRLQEAEWSHRLENSPGYVVCLRPAWATQWNHAYIYKQTIIELKNEETIDNLKYEVYKIHMCV